MTAPAVTKEKMLAHFDDSVCSVEILPEDCDICRAVRSLVASSPEPGDQPVPSPAPDVEESDVKRAVIRLERCVRDLTALQKQFLGQQMPNPDNATALAVIKSALSATPMPAPGGKRSVSKRLVKERVKFLNEMLVELAPEFAGLDISTHLYKCYRDTLQEAGVVVEDGK